MSKAKARILNGVLESIGPGKPGGMGSFHDYIDIGGQRVTEIGWSPELGYKIEKALGQDVRLAVFNSRIVAAIAVDGVVTKEAKRFPAVFVAIAMLAALGFGVIGLTVSFGMLMAAGDARASWPVTPMVLSQIPAVLILLYYFSCRAGFETAKTALDRPHGGGMASAQSAG